MNYKLKTSEKTKEILFELRDKTGITPNILARYALSLALTSDSDFNASNVDSNGVEFNRSVLLGTFDPFLKLMIESKLQRHLEEDEYFPSKVKEYLEQGVIILNGNFSLSKNKDTFIKSLLEANTGRGVI